MEVDLILCDIITNELSIDADRVVVYNQNFQAPTDSAIFVIVATIRSKIVGSNNHFDDDTNEEYKEVTSFIYIDIEITSQDRSALERKEEIIMALTSQYSLDAQGANNISIWRTKEIIDLSEIDGSSALHRFRIPVVVSQLKTKRTTVDYYDKFKQPEVLVEEK